MAKKKVPENSLKNLEKRKSFSKDNVDFALEAQKKSVEKRRERRALKEELLLLLDTNQFREKISLAMITEAVNGNVKAFEVIRDTIGEKPITKSEITGKDGESLTTKTVYVLPDELKEVEKHIKETIDK